jgi:hypothetical protein
MSLVERLADALAHSPTSELSLAQVLEAIKGTD